MPSSELRSELNKDRGNKQNKKKLKIKYKKMLEFEALILTSTLLFKPREEEVTEA